VGIADKPRDGEELFVDKYLPDLFVRLSLPLFEGLSVALESLQIIIKLFIETHFISPFSPGPVEFVKRSVILIIFIRALFSLLWH
jgi:hypothetical protein